MNHVKLLPIIIVGVAIGTLIALYVGYTVASKRLSQQTGGGTALGLLGALSGGK
jgi:hypothetical protein